MNQPEHPHAQLPKALNPRFIRAPGRGGLRPIHLGLAVDEIDKLAGHRGHPNSASQPERDTPLRPGQGARHLP